MAIAGAEWRRDIEAQPKLAGDKGVRKRPGVGTGVGQDVGVVLQDCRSAQAGIAPDLIDVQPMSTEAGCMSLSTTRAVPSSALINVIATPPAKSMRSGTAENELIASTRRLKRRASE